MAARDEMVAEYLRHQKKPKPKAKLSRHTPDTDSGGARWREDYTRWKKRRWEKMSQGPSRRQIT